jgi:uncharacterized membrane protein
MNPQSDILDQPRSVGATLKSGEGVKVEKSVTINRPVSEVFRYWQTVENLPRFMKHLVSVTRTAAETTHWIARTPRGQKVEWVAQTVEEKPDEVISWQSLPGSDLENAGSVRFKPAPGGRGTIVKVTLKYAPAEGSSGRLFAKFFSRDAKKEIAQSLFNLRSLLETSEIPTTVGQSRGDRSGK